MVFIVLCVEFTLNYNNVKGVLADAGIVSPGQLLPLSIGLFSLVRLLYVMYRERFVEHKDELNRKQQETTEPRSTRPSSAGDMLYGVITAWLPWLNCYDWWRRRGRHSISSAQRFRVLDQHEEYDTTKLRRLHLDGTEQRQ